MTFRIGFLALLLAAAGLLLRRMCRYRIPARAFVLIWDLVLARLLIPADLPFGIGISFGPGAGRAAASASAFQTDSGNDTLLWVWAAGTSVCLILLILTAYREYCILRTAVPLTRSQKQRLEALAGPAVRFPICISEAVCTPTACGFLRRRIVLPRFYSDWSDEMLRCVLTHESVHLRYHDPVHKFAAALIACTHWFNPAAWIACLMLGKDLEAACDEKTILLLGEKSRAQYAAALVDLADQHRHLFAGAPGFGCGTTKERILGIMKKKQLTVFIILAAVLVAALAVTVFAADPAASAEEEPMPAAEESGEASDGVEHEATIIVDGDSGAVMTADGETIGYVSTEDGFSLTTNVEDLPGDMEITVTKTEDTPEGAVTCTVVRAG